MPAVAGLPDRLPVGVLAAGIESYSGFNLDLQKQVAEGALLERPIAEQGSVAGPTPIAPCRRKHQVQRGGRATQLPFLKPASQGRTDGDCAMASVRLRSANVIPAIGPLRNGKAW